MTLRLDHVVIAVADLARAVEDYRALGFTVQIGGRHPGRSSHNALVVFEDGAYLELIAWLAPDADDRWYGLHARRGDGLVDFALLPEDTANVIAAAKSRGLELNGPYDGGRVRPDGRQLTWRTARQKSFDLPFLCGDVTPRELRVPAGESRRHANGALGVASLAIAVHDLDVSLGRYRALLGSAAECGAVDTDAPQALAGLRIGVILLEATELLLLAPSGPDTGPAARALREHLARRGEGACAMALRTSAERTTLDRTLAHETAIELVPRPMSRFAMAERVLACLR